MSHEFDPDLSIRQPMSKAKLKEIEAHMNRAEPPWEDRDWVIAGGYAIQLYTEVQRLQQELRERDRELAAAMKVVSLVECARDRLQDLMTALGEVSA